MNAGVRRDLRAAMYPWLASRAAIGLALAIVHLFRDRFERFGTRGDVVGLLGWDASFYKEIAQHGYQVVDAMDGRRFFPFYPMLARVFGGSDVALLLIANLAALIGLALVHRLTLTWCDATTARRAVWITALGPGVLASMMGYAEPLFLALAVGCFLALQQQSVLVAAILAYAAALTRPIGVLLVVAFVVFAWQRRDAWILVAAASPVAGLGTYLATSHASTGAWLTPFRLQERSNLRGENVDPIRAVWAALRAVVVDHRVGPGLHLVWAAIALSLCFIAWKRLPFAAAAFASLAVLTSLTTRNLDSFERYMYVVFPVAIAAATLRPPRWVDRCAQVIAPLMVSGYAVLAFATKSIP